MPSKVPREISPRDIRSSRRGTSKVANYAESASESESNSDDNKRETKAINRKNRQIKRKKTVEKSSDDDGLKPKKQKQISLLGFTAPIVRGQSGGSSDKKTGKSNRGRKSAKKDYISDESDDDSFHSSDDREAFIKPRRNLPKRSTRNTAPAQEQNSEDDEDIDDDDDHDDDHDDGDDDEEEEAIIPRKTRRIIRSKAPKKKQESEEDEDDNDDDDYDDYDVHQPKRSIRKRTARFKGKAQDDEKSPPRRSSRKNKCNYSMEEPNVNTAIYTLNSDESIAKKSKNRKNGNKSDKSMTSKSENEEEEDSSQLKKDETLEQTESSDLSKMDAGKKMPKSPKSPAVSHASKRQRVKVDVQHSSSSEDESDDTEVESEDDDELKIQRILATRTEPRRKWREICKSMNTSEIENGSRWFQNDPIKEEEEDTFLEKFLVKWAGMSFLHCSWEHEEDLLDEIDGAKTYLTTFFRKSENGCLFDAEERGDGEYFDPSFIQIDRILEVHDAELPKSLRKGNKKDEDVISKFGIILDKEHPDYESGTGRQFLIKWCNLSYSDCSYEFERDLILNEVEYEEHLNAFTERNKKPDKLDMKKADNTAEQQKRRLYKIFGEKLKNSQEEKESKVKEYQSKIESNVFKNGGQLRDYQAEGVSWFMSNHINGRSSILADEMGLGKTVQTAVYINMVATTLGRRGPFLIVAPLSTIPHWYREFTGWTDLNTIVYHGSARDREFIREFEFAFEKDRPRNLRHNQSILRNVHPRNAPKWTKTWMAQVVITTPEMLITDDFAEISVVRWEVLVVDEAHRLKNHSSKLANNLRNDRFQFDRILLLTGTPIQNNMNELWTLLNFVDPEEFGDIDKFLEQYGDMKSKESVDELHERIRPYILRRLKEDVEKSVPPKEETLIEVELTVIQKQYYRALYEKNVNFLHRNKKKAIDGPSLNNLAVQLRKCCNHPFLLRGVEEEMRKQEGNAISDEGGFLAKASGKLVLLDKLLPRLRDDGHRVLIFSQFKIMLDIIEDYLVAREMKAERIDGSITGKKRQMAIDRYQSKEKNGKNPPFIMLLSTRAGGVGINLTAADTCIIFDSDWNPQNDIQAQARCHRIGQTKDVKVYRLLSRKTYEMQMFHMSSLKMGLETAVLQGIGSSAANGEAALTKEEVERLLRHGAYDMFNEEKAGASEAESNEFVSQDIDQILARRSKTVVHENTGSKSNAAGGTFSKASFKAAGSGMVSTDGVAADDVDIDDPNFWSKMVGEAKAEDEKIILSGKKRKRKQANYKEVDFEAIKEVGIEGEDDEAWSSVEADSSSDTDEPNEENNEPRERSSWGGGKLPTEWHRKDAEKLVLSLQTHGYGNVSWESPEFCISKNKDIEEMKRMCWSLVFTTLCEVAEADAVESVKQAKKEAMKKTENEAMKKAESGVTGYHEALKKAEEGGVMGNIGNTDVEKEEVDAVESVKQATIEDGVPGDNETMKIAEGGGMGNIGYVDVEKEEKRAFSRLWEAHRDWAMKALNDSVAFAVSHTPRPEAIIKHLLDETFVSEKTKTEIESLSPLVQSFKINMWPSLIIRGWTDETNVESPSSPTRYKYYGYTYGTVPEVLGVVPRLHPELSHVVTALCVAFSADIADAKRKSEIVEKAKISEGKILDPQNMTKKSLKMFLHEYGPLQLLTDRKKSTKIPLSSKLLKACSYLHTAHRLVLLADNDYSQSPDENSGTESDKNDRLGKLITTSSTTMPHTSWNVGHDAALIRTIVKYGWIDRESQYDAMLKDKSIKWGFPFEPICQSLGGNAADKSSGKESKKDMDLSLSLQSAANRALLFLNKHSDLIDELKGFDKDRVAKSYGITSHHRSQSSSDGNEHSQGPPQFTLDAKLLSQVGSGGNRGDHMNHQVEFPSKSELMKRAKSILSPVSSVSKSNRDNSTESKKSSNDAAVHNFTVLDPSNRCYVLLAEILQGLIKFSQTGSNAGLISRRLLSIARKEAEQLCENASASEKDNLMNVIKHIQLVESESKRFSRPAKNVLRAILGMSPLATKNPNDPIYPDMKKPQLTLSGAMDCNGREGIVAESKAAKRARQRDSASGDVAITRALTTAKQLPKSPLPTANKNDNLGSLHLTSLETVLLSVVCSQGLPVWSEDWKTLFTNVPSKETEKSNSLRGKEFRISWIATGQVIETAAKELYRLANEKLQVAQQHLVTVSGVSSLTSTEAVRNLQSSYESLKNDVEIKKCALSEAVEMARSPNKLARRTIMLAEALRQRMGPIDVSRGGNLKKIRNANKSDNGLGPRVLYWCGRELMRWAESLQIIDKSTRLPLSGASADFSRCNSELVAFLDKKACRTIFAQVSQQTRLRSIFIKNGKEEMTTVVPKAVKNSRNNGDVWPECPDWWDTHKEGSGFAACKHDVDLLIGVLNFGFSGFEAFLREHPPFRIYLENEVVKNRSGSQLTRATIQPRVNHLTRELSALEDTADMIRMVTERAHRNSSGAKTPSQSNIGNSPGSSRTLSFGGAIQTGIDAFFTLPQSCPKKNGNLTLYKNLEDECKIEDECRNKSIPRDVTMNSDGSTSSHVGDETSKLSHPGRNASVIDLCSSSVKNSESSLEKPDSENECQDTSSDRGIGTNSDRNTTSQPGESNKLSKQEGNDCVVELSSSSDKNSESGFEKPCCPIVIIDDSDDPPE